MQRIARIELAARRALDDRAAALKALRWYWDAREFCRSIALDTHLTMDAVAGIVAALSPQNGWADQLRWTPEQCRTIAAVFRERLATAEELAALIPGPGFGGNKIKAARIALGERPLDVLSGPKVRAFYSCIVSGGECDTVCVDRWAWRIADGDASGTLTNKRYRDTAAAFVGAAARLRAAYGDRFVSVSADGPAVSLLTPANVQALTWVWWRDNEGERF